VKTAVGLIEPNEDRDAELARLREMLWLRLMFGAHKERSLNDHLIDQFRDVGRQMSAEGKKAARHRQWRSWGKWLQFVGSRLKTFASEIEAVR
jgi:hypothetical protein